MHSPDEIKKLEDNIFRKPLSLKKFAEDFAEFDRTDLLHMLLSVRKECTVLRGMLYYVYDDEFSETRAEVDARIKEALEKP